MKEPILVDQEARTLAVPHLGVTLRTMLGAALATWPDPLPLEVREYTVRYKNAAVATLNVRQHADI